MQQGLSERARRRGLAVMLAGTFLMWGGFFMVIPLISIHYVDDLGWAAGAIGLVLGIRQITQQGLTLVGGMLADKLGPRWLIAIGMLIRAGSFVLMGYADSYPLLLLSAVLAALGGALFDAPSSAAIAALTNEENRSRFYSLLGIVSGLGMTIGPLAGALLLKTNFMLVAFVAAGCFFVAFWIVLAHAIGAGCQWFAWPHRWDRDGTARQAFYAVQSVADGLLVHVGADYYLAAIDCTSDQWNE